MMISKLHKVSESWQVAIATTGLWFVVLFGGGQVLAAHPTCKNMTNPSQLKDCHPSKIWTAPWKTIFDAMKAGKDMPVEWQAKLGKQVNTGGNARTDIGAINAPYEVPTEGSGSGSGSGGGGGGGGGSGGGGSGGGGSDPACADYVDPDTLGLCGVRGETEPLGTGATSGECGASVSVDAEWVSLVSGSSHVAMTQEGQTEMEVYRMAGSSLSHAQNSALPEFYCVFNPSTLRADPVYIEPLNQYLQFANGMDQVHVAMRHRDGAQSDLGSQEFVPMTRAGGSLAFVPPPPNPEYFIALGALNVDPQCRSLDQLLDPLPANFGEIRYHNAQDDYCSVEYIAAGGFTDPSGADCVDMLHEVDMNQMQMYFAPGDTFAAGTVNGGSTFASMTVSANSGTFTTDATGATYYTGTSISTRPGDHFYLGYRGNGEQALLSGGTLNQANGNVVHVNPPGRIQVSSSGVARLVDGGKVVSSSGVFLREIAPLGDVAFDRNQPIQGLSNGQLMLQGGQVMPAHSDNQVRYPYNRALDALCNQPEVVPPPYPNWPYPPVEE